MPLGILTGLARMMRRKRTSSLDILSSKRAPRNYYTTTTTSAHVSRVSGVWGVRMYVPRNYYKGKNCKPTGLHTRKGGYVVVQEKLPNYVVPDLTSFKLKPYVSQCPLNLTTAEDSNTTK